MESRPKTYVCDPEKTEVRIVIGKPEGKKDEIISFYDAVIQRIKGLADAIGKNTEDFDKVTEWSQEIMAQINLVGQIRR